MWSMTATCLQQTKEIKYMKIGSRSLLKWPSHFTFFPGVFSSTQRWWDQYTLSRDKYFHYFQQIVQNINIFLQEDQLMCTKAGFSLVPVPGYLPNSNDQEQRNADQISQTACHEVNTITREMQVIMQGDNKHPHTNKTGSFSHLRSFELNNMGFSLSKISPITFDMDNPQTPADRGIKSRALTSTP